jgi:O-acetyl-ADP-ribose deacetylase (regulator of RNase III)
VKIEQRDILTVKKGIICHQVNCLGVMGAGLAFLIKKGFPRAYGDYMRHCDGNQRVGDVVIGEAEPGLWVAHLFGQASWRGEGCKTIYEAYPPMLAMVARHAEQECNIAYVPYGIGCGLAGGDWTKMLPILQEHLPDGVICQLPGGKV